MATLPLLLHTLLNHFFLLNALVLEHLLHVFRRNLTFDELLELVAGGRYQITGNPLNILLMLPRWLRFGSLHSQLALIDVGILLWAYVVLADGLLTFLPMVDRILRRFEPIKRLMVVLALRSRGIAGLRKLSTLIMTYHALRLLHVGTHVLFRGEPLELLTQLLVDHFHLEHLRVELHRSELDMEAIPWRNSATRTFRRYCLREAHRGLGLAFHANGGCCGLLLFVDELGVQISHVLRHFNLCLVVQFIGHWLGRACRMTIVHTLRVHGSFLRSVATSMYREVLDVLVEPRDRVTLILLLIGIAT